MKRIILIMFLFMLCLHSFGADNLWAESITGYKPIYMITGAGEDQVKVRISFKFDFLYPYKIGLYFGYSQLMFWDLYDLSGPFEEIDFNYDVFWRFESGYNFANDMKIPLIDYIQLGLWEHISNGMPGTDDPDTNLSRGMDRVYVQLQASVGSWLRFGINVKIFHCLFITFNGENHDNPDIQDYIGSFIVRPFLKLYNKGLDDTLELYGEFAAGGGPLGFDFENGGYLEVGFKSYTILSRFRLYAQYYQGYFESLLNYNNSVENHLNDDIVLPFRFRIGIIIE